MKTVLKKIFLLKSVLFAYIDIFTDVVAAYLFFYRGELELFILAVVILVVPIILAVCLPGQSIKQRALSFFQLRLFYEAVVSCKVQVETSMLTTMKLLESVVEAFPSSLLVLTSLLYDYSYSKNSDAADFVSKIFLLATVGLSVISTAWTLSNALMTIEEIQLARKYTLVSFLQPAEMLLGVSLFRMIVFMYHIFEITLRISSMAGLFIVANPVYTVPAVFFAGVAIRSAAAILFSAEKIIELRKNGINFFGRSLLSLVTDCVWSGHYSLSIVLRSLSTIEATSYLLLFVLRSDASTAVVSNTVSSCIACFVLKFFFGWLRWISLFRLKNLQTAKLQVCYY